MVYTHRSIPVANAAALILSIGCHSLLELWAVLRKLKLEHETHFRFDVVEQPEATQQYCKHHRVLLGECQSVRYSHIPLNELGPISKRADEIGSEEADQCAPGAACPRQKLIENHIPVRGTV